VWAELQRRAVAFEDNPNSVLRRLLGLSSTDQRNHLGSTGHESDSRVEKLLKLVEAGVGHPLVTSHTKINRSLRFKSLRGKNVAYIYPQNRRLKVESSERTATAVGLRTWDHWLKNGWWQQDDSVYWYVPNGDQDAYARAASVLGRLWNLNPAAS
jgi:hypothetical protein